MKALEKINLSAFLNSNNIRAQIAKGTASSFIIQTGFACLSFITAVVLARLLGPDGYGAYANAIAWVGIFGAIASFGFGSLLVRDVAILKSQSKWAELKGFLRYSDRFVLAVSILLVLIVIVLGRIVFFTPDKGLMRLSLWVAALLIPLSALATLKQSATRGFEHVGRSMLPDMIIRPLLILAGIILLYYVLPGGLSALTAMSISVVAAMITFSLSCFWLQRFLPAEISQVKPKFNTRLWLKAAFPMLVYVGLQILISQTSTVLIGLQRSAHEVGLFSIATGLSYILTFFLGAFHMILAPIMARMNVNGEKVRLQRILTITVRISFLLSLLLGTILIFGGDNILAIFGPEFIKAKIALVVLILANLVDIACGSPSLLLSMTGHERSVAIVFVIIALFNVLLSIILISSFGFEGAAYASFISILLSRLILALYAMKSLHLNTTIFGFKPKKENL